MCKVIFDPLSLNMQYMFLKIIRTKHYYLLSQIIKKPNVFKMQFCSISPISRTFTLNKIEKSLLNELKETQTKLGTEFEVHTQALEEISVNHQRLRRLLDDNLLKRKQELEKEITRYIRKIQELGSLPPSSELDAFVKSSIAALMKKLEYCNKKLKKYSHVNKKSYDQYVNFN